MNGGVRVWCLRHAQAENVTAGIAGSAPDPPLTTHGRHEAIAAVQTLAGEAITRIYSSTELRARQTAELLATVLAVDVEAMPELVEVGIGEHEGTTDPAIRARIAPMISAWIVDGNLSLRIADGESGQRVVARVATAFQTIASTHAGETVVVVGHVASLSVALSRLCALGATTWGEPLPHALPFVVEWDGRVWRCPAWPGAVD
jgi:alpha-ribazole phosphatase/probable phosphoglycerate mutase